MMETHVNINYLAVLVTAIVHFGIGGLWYSPLLFGNAWIKAMDLAAGQMEVLKAKAMARRAYVLVFFGTLVMAFVTAYMVDFAHATTLRGGLETGFWLWLGYIATFSLTGIAFEGKSFKLYLINNGYQLLGLLIMGAILAVWM